MSLRQRIQKQLEEDTKIANIALEDILLELAEEIDSLKSELALTQRRCDRNRDTSEDWLD